MGNEGKKTKLRLRCLLLLQLLLALFPGSTRRRVGRCMQTLCDKKMCCLCTGWRSRDRDQAIRRAFHVFCAGKRGQ